MFELFLAEPHLKHSITSLKVTAYATFYWWPEGNLGFCERKDWLYKRNGYQFRKIWNL